MSHSVLIVDMYKQPHKESQHMVVGFATLDIAREYARRRTWASVEEQRRRVADVDGLRKRWFELGENCSVVDDPKLYHGLQDLDYFIEHPASGDDDNWRKIDPNIGPRT